MKSAKDNDLIFKNECVYDNLDTRLFHIRKFYICFTRIFDDFKITFQGTSINNVTLKEVGVMNHCKHRNLYGFALQMER
jgi:hypothetical protein